jgi:ubiquinone/menaquinone biosynthesis C-methylase UbiE
MLSPATVRLLRCPVTNSALQVENGDLVAPDGRRYRVSASGIPQFAERFLSADAKRQQQHYDRVAAAYLENLAYPHTREYSDYLDRAMLDAMAGANLQTVAELCCGRGEAFHLLRDRVVQGVGVDVSLQMLEAAVRELRDERFSFVQGDATMLPLASDSFDSVVMFGGIHHVGDRQALFQEVARILKPGGRFYWREPVSDFFLWRALRAVIYRVSPALDHQTERPLLKKETQPPLLQAGLTPTFWRTYGFFGFCLFMNSDVLVFNRLFRFIPGIRAITRLATRLDDWTTRMPGFKEAGLQVIGVAEKRKAVLT